MVIRPIISAPLPWLTILFGRFYPKNTQEKKDFNTFFSRTLKITKLGKWYIAILLLIGIAAINTGNNLLYLVVGMLLSLIIISSLMSESTLRGIKVTRSLPEHVFADTPVIATLEITNTKSVFPSFSFNLSELNVPSVEYSEAYVLKLKSSGRVARHVTYRFKERGEITLSGLLITTSFPFSLFRKGKREQASLRRIIYPRLQPVRDTRWLNSFEAVSDIKKSSTKKGDGIELHSLKEYSPEDDYRRIDWKSSARAQKLLIKEFETEEERRLMIDFDNTRGSDEEFFEECVSKAASLACHLIERGFHVGLTTRETTLKCAQGRSHLFTLLDILALIEPDSGVSAGTRPGVVVKPV